MNMKKGSFLFSKILSLYAKCVAHDDMNLKTVECISVLRIRQKFLKGIAKGGWNEKHVILVTHNPSSSYLCLTFMNNYKLEAFRGKWAMIGKDGMREGFHNSQVTTKN